MESCCLPDAIFNCLEIFRGAHSSLAAAAEIDGHASLGQFVATASSPNLADLSYPGCPCGLDVQACALYGSSPDMYPSARHEDS